MKDAVEETQNESVNYSCLPDLLGHLFGLSHLHMVQLALEIMAPVNLTPKQYVALEFIANNPSFSQKEIANHIGTTPPVMVSILNILTERGYVQRIRSDIDRRRHSIRITELGAEVLPRARELIFEVETVFDRETGLSPAERETLLAILQKVTNR